MTELPSATEMLAEELMPNDVTTELGLSVSRFEPLRARSFVRTLTEPEASSLIVSVSVTPVG